MRNTLTVMALWLGLAGCGMVDAVKEGIVEAPSADVVGVEVVDQTREGVAVEVVVEMTNPNDVELPLESVHVNFELVGIGRFDAPSPATVSLPPLSMQRLRVRAALPTRGREVAGQVYQVSASVKWVPPGEVRAILTESGVPLPFAIAKGEGALGETSGREPTGG